MSSKRNPHPSQNEEAMLEEPQNHQWILIKTGLAEVFNGIGNPHMHPYMPLPNPLTTKPPLHRRLTGIH